MLHTRFKAEPSSDSSSFDKLNLSETLSLLLPGDAQHSGVNLDEDELNRYLNDQFGRFGILLTRNPMPAAMFRNTIDLWAGQRRCIIALTDQDLELIVELFESKQRDPIDVVNKKYVEFM